jgi:hypothetical protein
MSTVAEPLVSSTHDEKHFEGARLVQTKPELEHAVEIDHGVADASADIPPPPADPIDDLPMHQVIQLLRSPVSDHAANISTRSSAARARSARKKMNRRNAHFNAVPHPLRRRNSTIFPQPMESPSMRLRASLSKRTSARIWLTYAFTLAPKRRSPPPAWTHWPTPLVAISISQRACTHRRAAAANDCSRTKLPM